MQTPTVRYHADLALLYRGVKVYHTLRDLEAGRQNATISEHWLTWTFSGRSLDDPRGGQFDVRELPNGGKPLVQPAFQSPLLSAATVQRLAAFIDGELAKAKAERVWEKSKG